MQKRLFLKILMKIKSYQRLKKKNKKLIVFLKNKKFEIFQKFFNNIKKNKNYLIVGTNDHTLKLSKNFKKINKEDKNLFFLEIYQNDNSNSVNKKITFINQMRLSTAKKINWENILISSNQHMNFIKNEFLKKNNLDKRSKEIFVPYKNYVRSIMDIN